MSSNISRVKKSRKKKPKKCKKSLIKSKRKKTTSVRIRSLFPSHKFLECLSDAQHQRFEELLDLLEQGELTLDSLKPAELQQFSMFLSDKNNLQGLIKEWEPWWENEDVKIPSLFSLLAMNSLCIIWTLKS